MNAIPFQQLGPYRLERSLGRGGMGSVYLGVDEQTGRPAAVKVLSPSLVTEASFRARFGAEIETLKKLKHPNIVQLLGYGEQEGHLFYAMEYIDGRTLQDELKAGRRFTWREVARVGVECCQALKHAHDRGIIHRDLKPANLIYTNQEHVKLLDFGIAKLYGMTQLTIAGGVLGTVDFMAPEQAEGRGVTARSDLYSLGGVMFALLARRPPFVGRNVPDILHKLRYDDPPLVRTLAPDVPREFELIISQLLAKKPEDRIATALALANRLKAMEYALSPETLVDQEAEMPPSVEGEYRLEALDDDHGFISGDERTIASSQTRGQPGVSEELLRRHQSPTIAMSDLYRASAAESAAGDKPATPPRSTHFTTFDEEARRRAQQPEETRDTTPLWLKVAPALGAVIIVVLGVWYMSKPPSPDHLYGTIAKVGVDAEPQTLVQVEDAVDRFLELYPDDPRSGSVRAVKEKIELYRIQKRYERRARIRGGMTSLDVVERAYLDASRLAQTDPVAAAEKMRALLAVFDDPKADENTKRCLRLAREQLPTLAKQAEKLRTKQIGVLQQRLDAADRLDAEDPARAAAIRRGIIELYGNAAWAHAAVERARKKLGE